MSAIHAEESRTVRAARAALDGRVRGLRAVVPFIGPAVIASIAYMDPGNFATNIQSGAEYGYNLLWVVVLTGALAMFYQNLSAKLGIATGKNLPEMCRERFSHGTAIVFWVVSEIAAMATDLAEFLGASIGLGLLFHMPLMAAVLIVGVATYAMLMLDRFGFRPLEILIGALVGVIVLSYLVETVLSRPSFAAIASHSVIPWLGGPNSVLLMVGIVGATIMPHAVYLHSGLTQGRVVPRSPEEAPRIHRFELIDVVVALGIASLINMAILYMSAAVFHATGHASVADISTAYRTLTPLLGAAAAGVFLTALLASGMSSSVVGTMAGQVIMQGFVGFRIPIWVRRVVTMIPTVVVVAMGLNATATLIMSQVILSLALPFPMISLAMFTRRRDIMGAMASSRLTNAVAVAGAGIICLLNAILIWQTVGLPLPFGG